MDPMEDETELELQAAQEELVESLKRVDFGYADHDDAVTLAAALGLSRYLTT